MFLIILGIGNVGSIATLYATVLRLKNSMIVIIPILCPLYYELYLIALMLATYTQAVKPGNQGTVSLVALSSKLLFKCKIILYLKQPME